MFVVSVQQLNIRYGIPAIEVNAAGNAAHGPRNERVRDGWTSTLCPYPIRIYGKSPEFMSEIVPNVTLLHAYQECMRLAHHQPNHDREKFPVPTAWFYRIAIPGWTLR